MSKTDEERRALLTSIGLNPDAPALVSGPDKAVHQPKASNTSEIRLAPPGVDPHLMPVEDIVFDERLLDEFHSLAFNEQGADAARHIFALYKSMGRNKERNGALQRKISSFITQVRRNRETGGMVKEKVASTKEQRDNAALLASQNVSSADLAEALRLLAEKRGEVDG